MRELFLIDPDVVFLNHGSFGACPSPVFEVYQRWQRELEWQPVEFLARRADSLLDEARAALAAYVNADLADLVFVQNATTGVNIVARSLPLKPGDEILTTDHEYGACDYTWEFVCSKTGANYVRQPVPLPIESSDSMIEALWSGVTERTRVLYISHITSSTGLIFPIEELIRRAKECGIFTLIDGAHAPGQLPLDLTALGADFYTGNCHKWLCAPKGAALLYVRREHQHLIDPQVISWGNTPGANFVSRHQMQGTRDLAAFLSVPAAIDFQRQHDWETVRRRCHDLTIQTRQRVCDLTGLPPIAPETMLGQMASMFMPPCDIKALKTQLYEDYRVEIPAIVWNEQPFLRVSFQGYNTLTDADALLGALEKLLPVYAPV